MKQSWAPDDISSKGMRALHVASVLFDHMSPQFVLPLLPVSHLTQLVAVLARGHPQPQTTSAGTEWKVSTHCFFTGLIAACLENRRVFEWNNEVLAVGFRGGDQRRIIGR